MSKTALLATAATVILVTGATGRVVAQTPPPPQGAAASRPAVQAPPQGPPPQGALPQGQPGPRGKAGRLAQRRGGPGQMGPAPMDMQQGSQGPQQPQGLGLNAEQRQKAQDLQRAMRDQTGPILDELRFTRRALHRELYADKRDNAKITALAARVASLEKQLADIRIKQATALSDLLTPRQRETMRIGRGPAGSSLAGRGRGGDAPHGAPPITRRRRQGS